MAEEYLSEKQFREIEDNNIRDAKKWIPVDRLVLSAIQIFASRYNNPRNPSNQCRFLIKLGTGIGKTSTSLYIAMPYIKLFHSLYAKANERRYVFIIGFSKSIFIRELMKFPEFNIISYEELFQIKSFDYKIANSSGYTRDRYKQDKQKLVAKIKRRISNEQLGGMIRFLGYKELANKLFISDIPPGANQTNIMQLYLDKKVKVNKLVLNQFRGGMIIGDEIHQAYNSIELNNYGLALQLISDIHKRDLLCIYLDATIINHSRRELIDNVNLIRDPELPPFKSEDFFANKKIIADLSPIYEQYKNKVIFLEEYNADYPEIRYIGEAQPGIDYLKFISCDMSPLHEQTFRLDDLFAQTSKHFMIYDMVIPNPDFPAEDYELFHPAKYAKLSADEKKRISDIKGLYDTDTAKKRIKDAPLEWRRKVGIEVKEENTISYFSGTFLARENLKIYSSKYVRMLDIITDSLKENPHIKFLIYHPFVKGSGIMMVQEILRYNGFIVFGEQYNENTYSSEMFITSKEWEKKNHGVPFHPSSFVTLHYDITDIKKNMLIDEFNSTANKFGKYIQMFIGAQKIKQSYNFRAVRKQLILRAPTNISEWIQIRGRIYRKHAMDDLPENMRFTEIYNLISTSPNGESLEVRKYKKKMEEFKVIQQIECEINKVAVNNYLSHPTGFKNIDKIGAKSYDVSIRLPDKIRDFRYYADDHHVLALYEISNLIKRAFVSIPTWTYDTLFEFCCESKMININILMNKNIFNLALKRLIFTPGQTLVNMKNIVLFDSENYIIDRYYVDGISYIMPRRVIVECGDYLFLASIDTYGNYQLYPDCFLNKIHKNIYNTFVVDDKKLNINQDYCKKVIKDYKSLPNKEQKNEFQYLFLLHYPKDVHHQILKQLVENGLKSLPKNFVDTYKKIGLLGKNWWIDDYQKHILEHGKWDTIPIQAQNRQENKIIIGIIEDEKFKLKHPSTTNMEYVTDKRTLERGMVCTSSTKADLEGYLKKLNGVLGSKSSTHNLCVQIFIKLIELEGLSQLNDDGLKYLYFL